MVTDKTPGIANATYTLLKSCEAAIVKTKHWAIGSGRNNGVVSLPAYKSGVQYDVVRPSCFAPDDLVLAQSP